MDIREFGTNLELEKKGVWVDIGSGAELLVARIGNPEYERLMRQRIKPIRRSLLQGRLAAEAEREIENEVLAKTVLLGWKGLTADGAELPYTYENAIKMLQMRDFRDLVREIADAQETFRAEAIEADSGNSEAR